MSAYVKVAALCFSIVSLWGLDLFVSLLCLMAGREAWPITRALWGEVVETMEVVE